MKINISPSKLKYHTVCPMNLVHKSTYSKPTIDIVQNNEKALKGILIHYFLEKEFSEIALDSKKIRSNQYKIELFNNYLSMYNEKKNEKLDEIDFSNLEKLEIMDMVYFIKSHLLQEFNFWIESYQKNTRLLTEYPLKINLGTSENGNEYVINGSIDLLRMYISPTKQVSVISIIDYKTGETPQTFNDIRHQMGAYVYALFKNTDFKKNIKDLIYKSKNVRYEYIIVQPNSFDGEYLKKYTFTFDTLKEEINFIAKEITTMIEQIEFYFNENKQPDIHKVSSNCKACDFILCCKKINKELYHMDNPSKLLSEADLKKDIELLYDKTKGISTYLNQLKEKLKEYIIEGEIDNKLFHILKKRRIGKWNDYVPSNKIIEKLLEIGIPKKHLYSSMELPITQPSEIKKMTDDKTFNEIVKDYVSVTEYVEIRRK